VRSLLLVLLLAVATACGFVPEKVSLTDPRVKPMLDAMALVDRASLGFTAVESDADIRIELRSQFGYDAMLHVSGTTRRTIAFRRKGAGYEWIGEQERHEGPKTYDSPDGTFRESITITNEIVPLSGGTRITYTGPDPRLENRSDLTLDDVRPILEEWNAGR